MNGAPGGTVLPAARSFWRDSPSGGAVFPATRGGSGRPRSRPSRAGTAGYTQTRMPSTSTHIPLEGDGEGAGRVGLGEGEADGAGAGAGEEPADAVGFGVGRGRSAAAACPRPAEVLGAATARAWTRWLACPGGWRCGVSGWTALGSGCRDADGGDAGWCGTAVMNTPAADAPATAVVAAAPHATGRALSAPPARHSAVRIPSSRTIAAEGRPPGRHSVRREARMASTTAARWHAASSVFDT
jgi:hypothetical protein